ncbi:MAG TPA: hypothetical protein VMV69_11220 [Pirellulales bacterium]|nr:hypothetical protein [Pirellulales bacterium]
MFHFPRRALLAAVWIGSAVMGAAAMPPSDTLLPSSTKGFVTVADVPQFIERWHKTELGRLLDDPAMQPFGEDLRRQLTQKWARSHAKLGLSLDDLNGLATGELSIAVVAPSKGKAALVMLVDVAGREAKARETIESMAAELLKQGAKRTKHDHRGTNLTVLQTPLKGERKEPTFAVYFQKDGLLVTTDSLEVATDIVDRLAGVERETLAGLPAYKAVMQRCQSAAGELAPHARWFVQPIELAEALRSWRDGRRKGGVDYLKVAKSQGFEAIVGVGGYVNLAVGPYGMLHRTFALAPPPHALAMRMLKFPNGVDFAPQPWVSKDLASYTTFQCDFLNAFDRVDTLFDEIYGEPGVFEDTIESVKNDPNGPQLDIRNDLVAHLGERATLITDYKLPITTSSQRMLLAIEVKDPAALAASLERSMKGDPKARLLKIREHDVWEILNEDDAMSGSDVVDPGISNDDDDTPAQPVGGAAMASSAVTVAQHHLFVASHIDLLEEVLAQAQAEEPLERDADYRLIAGEYAKLGAGETCARGFARGDEQYQAAYELFRQGKLPESDAFFARLLNLILGEDKEGVTRKPRLDGAKLPDFDVVRRHLGPAGSFAAGEPNGWFIVGFTVGKEIPLATDVTPVDTTKQ